MQSTTGSKGMPGVTGTAAVHQGTVTEEPCALLKVIDVTAALNKAVCSLLGRA